MFENILGQEQVVGRLATEIASGTLPSSVLFEGDPYGGKLSTALELARALSCREPGRKWNCKCSACESHRLLFHPYTLLLGSRYFAAEIAAAADTLLRGRREAGQYLFARSVRKLLRRFDPLLWEGGEPKLKAVQPLAEECDELLSELLPGRELPPEEVLSKRLSRLCDLTAKIAQAISESVPIGQIRKALAWAHTTVAGFPKILILEGAEQMLEGSRNALLKMLEEPPSETYFIMITTRKRAIPPTLLSRLRPYHFRARPPEVEREVLSKIFRAPEEFRSLREFFLAWTSSDLLHLRNETQRFLTGVFDPSAVRLDEELARSLSSNVALKPFLEELTHVLREMLVEGAKTVRIEQLAAWNELIRESALRHDEYNQSPGLLVEGLYYAMKGMDR